MWEITPWRCCSFGLQNLTLCCAAELYAQINSPTVAEYDVPTLENGLATKKGNVDGWVDYIGTGAKSLNLKPEPGMHSSGTAREGAQSSWQSRRAVT